jgi:hypothetical protein
MKKLPGEAGEPHLTRTGKVATEMQSRFRPNDLFEFWPAGRGTGSTTCPGLGPEILCLSRRSELFLIAFVAENGKNRD